MVATKEALLDMLAQLRVPEDRRALLEEELLDHLDSRIEVELVCGASPESAEQTALAAFGDLDELKASLERIEPAYDLKPLKGAKAGAYTVIAVGSLFVTLSVVLGPLLKEAWAAGLTFWIHTLADVFITMAGLPLLFKLMPRGLGAAIRAQDRASRRSRKDRKNIAAYRAVNWYQRMLVYLPILLMFLLPIQRADNLLIPMLHVWLGLAVYRLYNRLTSSSEPPEQLEDGHAA